MDGVIDLLDNWVEKGIEPPKSKSDDPMVSAIPAISLPETACPLGHYYAFPAMRGNNSGSAALTGSASSSSQARGSIRRRSRRRRAWSTGGSCPTCMLTSPGVTWRSERTG